MDHTRKAEVNETRDSFSLQSKGIDIID